MRRARTVLPVICIVMLLAAGCRPKGGKIEGMSDKKVEKELSAYAPVDIEVPWQLLDDRETAALEKLYMAASVMDELFLIQVSPDNLKVRAELKKKGDKDLCRLFKINFGPWDRLEDNRPFYGTGKKPDGANFYPPDMTRGEFEKWIEEHPGDAASFESNFTVIRRSGDSLIAVPYSKEYGKLLEKAAGYLREAADLTTSESLANFLRLRAESFLNDDYFDSDMAWMDVKDNVLDVTIGPYEVYEDNIFNYKAAFEAFICVRDPEESRRLDGLKGYLIKMEKNLPIEDIHKNLNRGPDSPISVVDELFSAGDTKAGVQTLAFNLPNDERVREAKGCKKVMLRNICHAKFDKILMPIAEKLIDPKQLPMVTFEAYFNHILLHEFSHGLGPGRITLADGTESTVNKELSNTYSTIEEAKADIVGEYNFYYLVDEGFYGPRFEKEAAVTFLAGFFRSVRFGAEEAHGQANMIIFNYMKDKGAYLQDEKTGRWSVDFGRVREAVTGLAAEILMLEALGDYEGATEYIEKYGLMGDDVAASLKKLGGVPVDIEPRFKLERRFTAN